MITCAANHAIAVRTTQPILNGRRAARRRPVRCDAVAERWRSRKFDGLRRTVLGIPGIDAVVMVCVCC